MPHMHAPSVCRISTLFDLLFVLLTFVEILIKRDQLLYSFSYLLPVHDSLGKAHMNMLTRTCTLFFSAPFPCQINTKLELHEAHVATPRKH